MTTPNTPCIVLGQIKICTSVYEIPVDNKKKQSCIPHFCISSRILKQKNSRKYSTWKGMDTIHKLNEFWSSQLHNLVTHTVQVQISNHSSKRHWNSKSTIRDSWKLPIEWPWRICLDLNLKELVEKHATNTAFPESPKNCRIKCTICMSCSVSKERWKLKVQFTLVGAGTWNSFKHPFRSRFPQPPLGKRDHK